MYKIVGVDQKEYGPVSLETLREWIAQGRANGQTIVNFEGGPWKPLSTFPEFADALRTAVPPPLPQATYVGIPTAVKSSTLSIWGLVCSCLGFCCMPVAIVGIVCSIMGYLEISKNPQNYTTNKAIPLIGVVLGLCIVGMNIFLFATGAFQNLIERFPR